MYTVTHILHKLIILRIKVSIHVIHILLVSYPQSIMFAWAKYCYGKCDYIFFSLYYISHICINVSKHIVYYVNLLSTQPVQKLNIILRYQFHK